MSELFTKPHDHLHQPFKYAWQVNEHFRKNLDERYVKFVSRNNSVPSPAMRSKLVAAAKTHRFDPDDIKTWQRDRFEFEVDGVHYVAFIDDHQLGEVWTLAHIFDIRTRHMTIFTALDYDEWLDKDREPQLQLYVSKYE